MPSMKAHERTKFTAASVKTKELKQLCNLRPHNNIHEPELHRCISFLHYVFLSFNKRPIFSNTVISVCFFFQLCS